EAERAVGRAEVVLLIVDAVVGVTDEDERVAALLQRGGPPAVVVANKVDAQSREADAWAFARLGLGDPWPVSALHGRGTGDLLDEVVRLLPPEGEARDPSEAEGAGSAVAGVPGVAIVGRPSVGTSTLSN